MIKKQGKAARTFQIRDEIWTELRDLNFKTRKYKKVTLEDWIEEALVDLIRKKRGEYIQNGN